MADEIESLAAEFGGATLDIFGGAIVASHVEGGGGKAFDFVAEVAGDGQGFEKDFWHDDRAPDVEDHAAFEVGADGGEGLEIKVGGLSEDRAIGGGVLVDDIGADGDVGGDGDIESGTRGENGEVKIGEARGDGGLAEGATGADTAFHSCGESGVHLASRFVDHAEAPVV